MTPSTTRLRTARTAAPSVAPALAAIAIVVALGLALPACSSGSSKADQCPTGWAYDLDNGVCIPLSGPKPDLASGADTSDTTSDGVDPQPDTTSEDSSAGDGETADLDGGVSDTVSGATTIVPLVVRETAGIDRTDEIVENGVPIPRALGLTATEQLAIFDDTGAPVPAQFRVLARWDAGRAANSAAIQWLLVTFPASVTANTSRTYTLTLSADPAHHPAPSKPLVVSVLGNQVVIDSGAARFTIGNNVNALFTKIELGGTTVVGAGEIDASVDGVATKPSQLRSLSIEQKGPLSATVVVRSVLDRAAVGGGKLVLLQRYRFSAGSPTAIVRQSLSWEGDLCGNGVVFCDGKPNGVLVEYLRSRLLPTTPGNGTVVLLPTRGSAPLSAPIDGNSVASLRQLRRTSRFETRQFEATLPGDKKSGELADAGLLAIARPGYTLAVSLFQMHRFEPQALRLLAGGVMEIGAVDGPVWLSSRQGLFVRFAVSALDAGADPTTLLRSTFAPLHRPLRGWPSASWFRNSKAVFELPGSPQPNAFGDYDTHVRSLLETTITKRDDQGLWGLMTTGLVPRYWSELYGYEVDCTDDTPGDDADNPYWCGTWTDYHNTLATAPIFAMRSGESEWLDELALPGALRQLHTQILQCAPEDNDFYCGMAPSGYGAYRSDFNSSHAYFDNLMLYYWLSGDYTVVETLERGASTMRGYLCPKRPTGNCAPAEVNSDPWAGLIGRVASQWLAVFRFVGLASDDASYLVDFRTGLSRAVTQHFVLARYQNVDYGFWSGTTVSGPGSYETDQLWMATLYDMNNLYRLLLDSNDAPIGEPAIKPSAVLVAWARTLRDFGSGKLGDTPVGDGTAAGTWPNVLAFEFSGDRIGGTLVSAHHTVSQSNPDSALYDTGKANLPAVLLRSAQLTGDDSLRLMGRALALLAWNASKQALQSGVALGKVQGLYLARLHAAIALLE